MRRMVRLCPVFCLRDFLAPKASEKGGLKNQHYHGQLLYSAHKKKSVIQ